MPRVDAATFSLALSHFARQVGAGVGKRVVLVLIGQASIPVGRWRCPRG